jgi:transposase-like protein
MASPLSANRAAGRRTGRGRVDFCDDLRNRGLRVPLLVISDAAGLTGAVAAKMPTALRHRCLIHRARNVVAKVPAERRDEIKTAFWEIFDLPDDIEPTARRRRRSGRTTHRTVDRDRRRTDVVSIFPDTGSFAPCSSRSTTR